MPAASAFSLPHLLELIQMSKILLIIVLTLSAFYLTALAQHGKPGARFYRPVIEKLVKDSSAETVAVAFHNLTTGEELLLNEHVSFHAASTMKVPVMMEIFHQASQGKFRLDDKLPVRNEFKSIVDGSPFTLDEKSDGDSEAYKLIGTKDTYRDLMHHMITRSSNLATNILIEKIGADNVMTFMKELHANDIKVLRGVEDGKAYEKGLNNTTSAYDLMILLRDIAEKKAISPSACDEMIDILLGQEFNTGIPAGLPQGTKVAHKTGWITKIRHDAAIVYPSKDSPYVLVVLTRGLDDEKKADQLISGISHIIYNAVTEPER
jgi:beta-lactamase class A